MKQTIIFKKTITVLALLATVMTQTQFAWAEELIPATPSTPAVPTPPPAPTSEPQPTPNSAPTPPPAPTQTPTTSGTPIPTIAPEENNTEASPTPTPTPALTNDTTNSTNNDQVAVPTNAPLESTNGTGNNNITTGDATNSTIVTNAVNTNEQASPSPNPSPGTGAVVSGETNSASITNTANGSGSENSSSAQVTDTNQTNQNNSANINNNINQDASTGNNYAIKNVGDTNISTGDANVSGTVVNAVNTNLDNVKVAEFNIVDNQTGDLVLDFNANCVSGCGNTNANVANTGNGNDSNNQAASLSTVNNATFQNNDATVTNDMVLAADSGHNLADKNTGGDTTITTGDANVSASAVTLANNNLDGGEIIYGVVNIYGNLYGDIVFPEELSNQPGTSVANTGNGADSHNQALASTNTSNSTSQNNQAIINNNLQLGTNTGNNLAEKNTDGNTTIQTGDTNVQAQVLNVANTNASGNNVWLVLVNEAGKWIGRILGAPEGSNVAGSAGTDFQVAENGNITAVNGGNGNGSQNNAAVSNSSNDTTVQNNTATINNNLNLSANTGNNSTSSNTGGNNEINTGDAKIIANLVNFVNNNITGGGKLVVTVVNVFGNWFGDLVTPGQAKDKTTPTPTPTPTPVPQLVSETGRGGVVAEDTTAQEEVDEETRSEKIVYVYPTSRPVSYRHQISTPVLGESTSEPEAAPEEKVILDQALVSSESANPKKEININLAWLLSLLPVSIGFVVAKRRKLS